MTPKVLSAYPPPEAIAYPVEEEARLSFLESLNALETPPPVESNEVLPNEIPAVIFEEGLDGVISRRESSPVDE